MNQQSAHNLSSAWDDDQHSILITTHKPNWTWDELHEHEVSVITPMVLTSDQPVALITDMRSASYFDPIDTSAHIRQTSKIHCALAIEMVVVVLRDPSVSTLMLALYERHGARDVVYRVARTLSEAHMLIADHRGESRYSNVIKASGKFKNRRHDRLAGD